MAPKRTSSIETRSTIFVGSTCSGHGASSSERGAAAVSYGYSFEDSLALLHGHAPGEGLTRSHSIVGALSMAICQWDSKFTVWATGVSSLLWWKALEERKKFSMPTTTNTPTPRCALRCPRWEVLVRRSKRVRPSGLVPTTRFAHCVYFACLRSRCRYGPREFFARFKSAGPSRQHRTLVRRLDTDIRRSAEDPLTPWGEPPLGTECRNPAAGGPAWRGFS